MTRTRHRVRRWFATITGARRRRYADIQRARELRDLRAKAQWLYDTAPDAHERRLAMELIWRLDLWS